MLLPAQLAAFAPAANLNALFAQPLLWTLSILLSSFSTLAAGIKRDAFSAINVMTCHDFSDIIRRLGLFCSTYAAAAVTPPYFAVPASRLVPLLVAYYTTTMEFAAVLGPLGDFFEGTICAMTVAACVSAMPTKM